MTLPTFTLPDGQVLTEADIHRQHAMFHDMASKLAAQDGYDEEFEDAELNFSIQNLQRQADIDPQPQLVHPTHKSTTPPVFTLDFNDRSPSQVPPFASEPVHPPDEYTVTNQSNRGLPAPPLRQEHLNTHHVD